ncbi:MAG: hypothetical protein QXP97_00300 [Desulfurococcus sp.]|jgi:hypothetical protein|uniref:hypothetical protein n=1 Tax=Desulfurococcus sp. TaxID=51678 RepID=UPI0031609432
MQGTGEPPFRAGGGQLYHQYGESNGLIYVLDAEIVKTMRKFLIYLSKEYRENY